MPARRTRPWSGCPRPGCRSFGRSTRPRRASSARCRSTACPVAASRSVWRWPQSGRSMTDLWLAGTAVADGLSIHEARLGPWRVESNTRTTDLPTMVAQTLGAVFAVMEEYEDLWLATTSGLPVPTDGPPVLPSDEPVQIDVE